MKIFILFIHLLMPYQAQDSLVPLPDLKAFTHPKFFVHDCKCGMFNPKYFQLEVYKKTTDPDHPDVWIIPPCFEYGHAVSIIGKQGDFFRIKFIDEEYHPICYNCSDTIYYVKKGTLGSWVFRFNFDTYDFDDEVPLYNKPHENSKTVAKLKTGEWVVILDCEGKWMYVESITKGKKKRGWLNPTMQCGNPVSVDAPNVPVISIPE